MRGIHSSPDSNGFIGVDPPRQFPLWKHGSENRLHLWDATRAPYEQHLINVPRFHAPVHLFERTQHRNLYPLQQVSNQPLKLLPRHLCFQRFVTEELIEANVRFRHPRKIHLELRACLPELVERLLLLVTLLCSGKVHPCLGLEDTEKVLHEASVNVLSTKPRITVCSTHFEVHAPPLNLHDCHVKRASPKVKHKEVLLVLGRVPLRHPKRQRRSRRLVDDALHLEPRNAPSVARRLALAVVEVCGHGDDCLFDWATDELLRHLLQVRQHPGPGLFGRNNLGLAGDGDLDGGTPVALVDDLEGPAQLGGVLQHSLPVLVSNQALRVVDHRRRVLGPGTLRSLADPALLLVGEANPGRSGVVSALVRDDVHLSAIPHSDARASGSQINADSVAVVSHTTSLPDLVQKGERGSA
mmetsp:Transcript_19952/g.48114  ORF Transcript_19952/g.48114 Transcript_19952/m.48114 type:complete len:412 (-) Transcript_19952:26-1261(-)